LKKVVTNAPNVVVGSRVVVATVGAAFRGESGEDETVRKGSVGGVMSSGMICNAAMLGWKGGDNKAAVILPDTFPVGSKPPESRPRKE
jgi:tRNA-binding EMAP/Myf-like protein